MSAIFEPTTSTAALLKWEKPTDLSPNQALVRIEIRAIEQDQVITFLPRLEFGSVASKFSMTQAITMAETAAKWLQERFITHLEPEQTNHKEHLTAWREYVQEMTLQQLGHQDTAAANGIEETPLAIKALAAIQSICQSVNLGTADEQSIGIKHRDIFCSVRVFRRTDEEIDRRKLVGEFLSEHAPKVADDMGKLFGIDESKWWEINCRALELAWRVMPTRHAFDDNKAWKAETAAIHAAASMIADTFEQFCQVDPPDQPSVMEEIAAGVEHYQGKHATMPAECLSTLIQAAKAYLHARLAIGRDADSQEITTLVNAAITSGQAAINQSK